MTPSIIECNVCTEPTPADFYVIEPTGSTNFWRPVCANCGVSHISKVPTASLRPIAQPLTESDLYHLCMSALTMTTQETINGSKQAAQIRTLAKHELRKRLSNAS